MQRIVGGLLLACGFAIVVASAVLWVSTSQSKANPWFVEQPILHFPEATAETQVEAAYMLHNRSGASIRVVGIEYSCGDEEGNCCIRGLLEAPISIPPGGSAQVPVTIRVGRPGPFSHDVAIYVEAAGALHETRVGVKGVAKAKDAERGGVSPLRM